MMDPLGRMGRVEVLAGVENVLILEVITVL